VLEVVDSTNEALRRLAAAGAVENTVVIADRQTAGRGRRGRAWHSPAGLGLYVSSLHRPPDPGGVTRWTLAAAVAACETCRDDGGADARIDWPNDVIAGGRKLAGVLCEARSAERATDLVVGCGINVGHEPDDFPEDMRGRATSLRIAGAGGILEREILAAGYLRRLAELGRALAGGGWDAVARRWLRLAPGARGARVRIGEPGGSGPTGTTDGIAEDGALVVRVDGGGTKLVRLAGSVEPLVE